MVRIKFSTTKLRSSSMDIHSRCDTTSKQKIYYFSWKMYIFHQIVCLAFDWVWVRMRCLLKVSIKLINLPLTNKNNPTNPNPTKPQPNHEILVCFCIWSTLLWLKYTAYEAKGQLYLCCSIISGHVHVQNNFLKMCRFQHAPVGTASNVRHRPPSAPRPCHACPTHQPFVTPVKPVSYTHLTLPTTPYV